MKKEEFESLLIKDVWDKLLKINPFENIHLAKTSYYIGLDIYRRLERIKESIPQSEMLLKFYEDQIFGHDKKTYIQKVLNSPYVSDRVALLYISDSFFKKYGVDIEQIRSELIEKVWKMQCNSKENALDNVLMAQFLYYFLQHGLVEEVKKEYLNELILDLSNVSVWKYNLVTVSEYKRKIHNSYHFSNPYFLLYWLSMCQKEYSILYEPDYKVLQKVIEDGYKNRKQLSSLSLSLLATSSGIENTLDQRVLLEEMNFQFDQIQGFKEEDTYFNYNQFGNEVLGSSLLNAVVCLESMMTVGLYDWKEFRKEERSNPIKQVGEMVLSNGKKSELNRRTIQMTMKNHCMAPFLEEGDEILVSFDSDLHVDDILVFRHYKGMMMAHRVLDIIVNNNKTVYITGADNGSLWEYPVFQKDVVGKVTRIHRRREFVC